MKKIRLIKGFQDFRSRTSSLTSKSWHGLHKMIYSPIKRRFSSSLMVVWKGTTVVYLSHPVTKSCGFSFFCSWLFLIAEFSIKEGICSDTAMLFLPFFADQPRNALFARQLGIAEVIYKKVWCVVYFVFLLLFFSRQRTFFTGRKIVLICLKLISFLKDSESIPKKWMLR